MLQDDPSQRSQLPAQCAHAHGTADQLNAWTAAWHENGEEMTFAEGDLLAKLHRANFDLWHLEDRARDRGSSDAVIVEVKRGIDQINQTRNDTSERIDEVLLMHLAQQGLPAGNAPLHSETPGQIMDRLSILALKRFHTAEEAVRIGVSREHRDRNQTRLAMIEDQQNDLAECLALLWTGVMCGQRRFKQYRQMKMYNDPQLNPVLYRSNGRKVSH